MKIPYRRSIQVILAIAAVAIAVSFVWKSRAHAMETYAADQMMRDQPEHASASPRHSVDPRPSLPARDGAGRFDDYEDNPLGDVLRRVLSNDPQLVAFKHYHNRPLLDEASKQRYREILSDPTVFDVVKHDLLYPDETKADQAESIKRLMKIDYLREALEWKENPMRSTLIALVSELILTDNFPSGMGMDMRISLSGNKRELYELLYEVAPDQANATVQASKGTRLEKLIAYIDNSLRTQRRLEASLENEVTP
jgi:hypothetical protein